VALDLLDKHPRQIYVLPCGSGKSRVAATIALLLLILKTSVKKIYLIYLNDVLKKKDQEDFQDLWSMMPNAERVTYHSSIGFTPGPNSVVVLDESDQYCFDDPIAFQKFVRKTTCVCLTATCSDDQTGGLERAVLKKMNFKIFEDLVDGTSQQKKAP